MGALDATEDPEWTAQELKELETKKYEFIKMMHELGHGKRYWDDVKVGDELPLRVFGPHSIASLATEWRAYLFTIWGAHTGRVWIWRPLGSPRSLPAMRMTQ